MRMKLQNAGWRLARVYWPLLLALVVLWRLVDITVAEAFPHTGYRLVYALDDAYIHMAVAKHFVQDGVWGVTPFAFSSSTSSPLWTFLLALVYAFTGVSEIAPFAMNFVCAVLLLITLDVILRRQEMPTALRALTLLLMIHTLPFVTLIYSGMEHMMQLLLTALFAYCAATHLSRAARPALRDSHTWALWALAALLAVARYEGLFVVAAACLLYLLRGWWRHALLLAAAGFALVTLYGLISVSHGWPFLPGSVVLKTLTNRPPLNSLWFTLIYIADSFNYVRWYPPYTTLLLAGLALFMLRYERQRRLWTVGTITLLLFAIALPFQVRLVRFPGPMLRYEAHLLLLGLLALGLALIDFWPRRFLRERLPIYGAAALSAAIILYMLFDRVNSLPWTVQASINIYEQQYQMARFVRDFYDGEAIVANDIGAINYYADLRLIDLVGLGTLEIAQLRMEDRFSVDTLREAVQGAKIAIVYEAWYPTDLPAEWVKVGEWKIFNNAILGSDKVSFFAIDPVHVPQLAANLQVFSATVPDTVVQNGLYVG